MTKLSKVTGALAVAAMCAASLAACGEADKAAGTSSSPESGKYKVALSLSYTGNDWQDEAANLVKAAAKSDDYKDKVDLTVDIAGSEVTKQIQTLNNEIASGVNAIVVYPISPTALNSTIKKACDKGIKVFAYDSLVTEPCAYNVHIDQYAHAYYTMSWLAEELKGKGTIANITGVPGTTVDQDRQKAVKDVLKKFPGITVAGAANGAWAQTQGAQAFQQIWTAHPDIDGVFAEVGCWSIAKVQIAAGKTPLPCAGEYSNGHHIMMLPKALGGIGYRSSSAGSPVYSGEMAFISAVRALDGEKVAHDIILPIPKFNTDDVNALGDKAVNLNPAEGGLMVPPGTVSGGFFDGFWSPLVTQGIKAAQTGQPDTISSAKKCSEVKDCIEQDKLVFDDNHSGGN